MSFNRVIIIIIIISSSSSIIKIIKNQCLSFITSHSHLSSCFFLPIIVMVTIFSTIPCSQKLEPYPTNTSVTKMDQPHLSSQSYEWTPLTHVTTQFHLNLPLQSLTVRPWKMMGKEDDPFLLGCGNFSGVNSLLNFGGIYIYMAYGICQSHINSCTATSCCTSPGSKRRRCRAVAWCKLSRKLFLRSASCTLCKTQSQKKRSISGSYYQHIHVYIYLKNLHIISLHCKNMYILYTYAKWWTFAVNPPAKIWNVTKTETDPSYHA